jgi:peptidylamidoglycolate lyase
VPSLTLGEAFVPGSDEKHFCKPTDVAVSSSGIFFVSDGYCNKRIMKFDPNGRLLKVYTGSFNIVHSLTLQEEKDALCVADRENSRVVCIHAGLKEGPGQPSFGSPYGPAGYKGKNVGRVFAVAAKGTEIKPVNDTAPKKIRDPDDVISFSLLRDVDETCFLCRPAALRRFRIHIPGHV